MDLGSVIGMSGFAFALMAVIALLCSVLIRVIVAILARTQASRAQPAVTPVSVSVTGRTPGLVHRRRGRGRRRGQ